MTPDAFLFFLSRDLKLGGVNGSFIVIKNEMKNPPLI